MPPVAPLLPAGIPAVEAHDRQLREHYDRSPELGVSARAYRRALARLVAPHIPEGARVLEVGCGEGLLLAGLEGRRRTGIDLSPALIERARRRLPAAEWLVGAAEQLPAGSVFDCILISDTLNEAGDVEELLRSLRRLCHERTRLILTYQNNLHRPTFAVAGWFGLHRASPGCNWLSTGDLHNLLSLTGWEPVARGGTLVVPWILGGAGALANRVLAPLVPGLALSYTLVARPAPPPTPARERSVSVVIPARNEAGNIAACIERLPRLAAEQEVIFVEGHSSDGTWQEIQRTLARYPHLNLRALRQSGSGKGNAVREAFAAARGDLLLILDADLSVPPEELPRFVRALREGRLEFANGSRLVYPMEGGAMPFLNRGANRVFAGLMSFLIGQPVKDSLCGTKALLRSDYLRMQALPASRREDPFGDFDLLLGASQLGLRIGDVPVHYRARTYGTTNILRWRDGWRLVRLLLSAARRLRFR